MWTKNILTTLFNVLHHKYQLDGERERERERDFKYR